MEPQEPEKKSLRFTAKDDVALLREVAAIGFTYDKVAVNVSAALGSEISRRAAHDRTERLIKQYKANDVANLRRSGTEEEYNEKEQLLQELAELHGEEANRQREDTEAKRKAKDKKENEGQKIRQEAMKRMVDKTGEDEPGTSSKKPRKSDMMQSFLNDMKMVKIDDINQRKEELRVQERRLKLEEERLALEREERRGFMQLLLNKK